MEYHPNDVNGSSRTDRVASRRVRQLRISISGWFPGRPIYANTSATGASMEIDSWTSITVGHRPDVRYGAI